MDEQKRQQRLTLQKCTGKEIFEIKPVILGGSPTDPANKILLSREDHIKAVTYWNSVISGLRYKRESSDLDFNKSVRPTQG
jgi:hypothetical protein